MKHFRAYFNRHREQPQVWSIDEGDQSTEINVSSFAVNAGCIVASRYNGDKPNEDSPSAWIEIHADYYYIVDGAVHFARHAVDGRP